jgi:uncharacterized membrane protein HdeD (DUF308 family)
MLVYWILTLIFGILVIVFPDLLAYLIWWFFIFLGANIIVIWFMFKKKKWKKESYVEIGDYKIYR